jgi:putative ABC transport system permease protein
VHDHHDEAPVDPAHPAPSHAIPPREITAMLITYKSDYAAVKLPALINKTTTMMAASPALEMHRLWNIIGVGGETIRFFGDAIVFIAGAGFFVTLWGAVADRRYDIALMRSLGATRRKIFSFVLVEGLTLGMLGVVLGIVLGHIFAYEVQRTIEASRHMTLDSVGFHPYEFYLILIALLLSGLVALIPAVMAYRVNVAAVLSKNA